MIKGPTSLTALTLGLYLTGNLIVGVFGILLSWALILLFYDVPNANRILAAMDAEETLPDSKSRFKIGDRATVDKLLHLIRQVAPLGFISLLISLCPNIPRYFIQYYLGERQLGLYASVVSLMVIDSTVVTALAQSAIPRFGRYHNEGRYRQFVVLLRRLVVMAGAIGATMVLITAWKGRELLGILFSKEYAAAAGFLSIIMLASTFQDMIFFVAASLNAVRRLWIQLWVYLFVTAEAVLLGFLLVPRYGLKGAAWLLLLDYVTLFLAFSVVLGISLRGFIRERDEGRHKS
jgi:O-antigen/teichoic acid export membrane protein